MPELTKVQTGFLEPQGPFKLDAGTAGSPGVYFEGDETTGFYRTAEDEIGVSIDGTQKYNFTSEGLKFNGTSLDGTPFMGAIDKDITDTAVDVFVYDTSRDTDGGAWRKRTQHTSWYNENLNTATRGSRREFPAVAVIVATTSKVTIYDGDDPDLPMWMVFQANNDGNISTYILQYTATGGNSVVALNGIITSGHNSNGATTINFINEISTRYRVTSASGTYHIYEPIVNRNSFTINYKYDSIIGLVNSAVNDVAMTVLPTAPIDPDTGLQVPTIAVATNDGISVIKDDGTVISTTSSSSGYYVRKINFTDNFGINAIISNSSGGNWINVYVNDFKSLDGFTYAQYNNWDGVVYRTKYDPKALTYLTASTNDTISNFIHLDGRSNAIGGAAIGGGLTILEKSPRSAFDPDEGMVAYATTSYNTGWMHGNIKGAFLSDTDATNVTGTELVTNGTFTTNTDGWTANSNATISVDTQRLKFEQSNSSGPAYVSQGITTVVGKSYVVNLDFTAGTQINVEIYIGTTLNGFEIFQTFITSSPYTKTFIATSTTTYITFRHSTGTTGRYCFLDNISVRIADPDRSVNNKGLQVFGTITKSAVATGAELVGYGNFNAGNYLLQPYNSDLDFGTGDFCYMCWVKDDNVQLGAVIFQRGTAVNGNETVFFIDSSFRLIGRLLSNNGVTSNVCFIPGVWNHCVLLRKNGILQVYHNGVLQGSVANTESMNQPGKGLSIGAWLTNNNYFVTAISLFRVSASAPSAEQIKKIYEDEKVLFQENANATLYGSSNSVTALAYDEKANLLHVGTSSGRSDFNGLRRINNTTTAVTTAISAYDGSIAQQ